MKRLPRLIAITFWLLTSLPSIPVQPAQATPQPDPWLRCRDSEPGTAFEDCLDASFEQAARSKQPVSYKLALDTPFGFAYITAALVRWKTGAALPRAALALPQSPQHLTVRTDVQGQTRSGVWHAPTPTGPLRGYYWRGLRNGQLTTVVNEYSALYRLTVTLTFAGSSVAYTVPLITLLNNDLCVSTLTGEAAEDFADIGSSIVCDVLPDFWMPGQTWR